MNNHKMLTKRRTFLISCVEWVVVSHRGNEGSVSSPVKDLCRGLSDILTIQIGQVFHQLLRVCQGVCVFCGSC